MLVSYCKCLLLILERNLSLCNTSLHVARNTETTARVRVSTPDCRLEASTDPEGSATDQLEPGFLWSSSVVEQMVGSYPRSMLNCTLLMQPSQRDQNFVIMLPSKHKIEPKLSTCSFSCRLHTVHFPSPHLHYQTLFLI